jgi:phage gp36-like protein
MFLEYQLAYCVVQDIIDRLSSAGVLYLVDDDNDGVLDASESAYIQTAIDEIATEIDAALAPSFNTPLTLDGNVWVKVRAVDLACERLCERKGQNPTQSVTLAAERSRQMLDQVRMRELRVPNAVYPGDGFDIERRKFGLPLAFNPGGK